jgi:hypothetical protein
MLLLSLRDLDRRAGNVVSSCQPDLPETDIITGDIKERESFLITTFRIRS